MGDIRVAVQMYSLRDYTEKDFIGTLRYVAEIGYAGVEFAGFGGLGATELRRVIDDLGLKAVSAHVGLRQLESQFDEVIESCLALGAPWVTIPSLPGDLVQDEQGWIDVGVRLNALGAQCKKHGVQLCYHNHSFEFAQFEGRYGLDILYGASGADLLQAQLDVYWIKRAGEDPVEYVRKYTNRCPLVHLKDMEAGEEQFFAEVGEGIMDLDSLLAVAKDCGVRWHIVEQDQSRRDTKESVRISIDNLKARGLA